MFVLFQHQHPGAITQHETVAIFIPRTAGLGGLVVAVGERLGRRKTPIPIGVEAFSAPPTITSASP